MYEYAPVFAKKKEKLLTFGLLAVGLLVCASSYVLGAFDVAYYAIPQLLGIGCIVAMILLFSLVLSRRYVYSVEESESGGMDFVITEYYGRRRTVVCRVSVTSVRMAIPYISGGKTNAKDFDGRFYRYTGVLFDEERYNLHIEEAGERFVVQICANKDLISILTNH